MSDRDAYKRQAAERAAGLVESGMAVGLGTGSTAVHAIRRIGALLAAGELRDVVGVPTSAAAAATAREAGIPLAPADLPAPVDLAIDGADEIDPRLDLVKGAGGAFVREKLVAQASARFVVVADDSKLVDRLGSSRRVPVEALAFGWRSQERFLAGLGARVELRDGFATDSGNLVLDCDFGPLEDPAGLAAALDARAGIVGHGIFLGLAGAAFVAGPDGLRELTAPR